MSTAPSIFSTGNLLKNFAFTYFPVTDWRRFISPTIVFGNANLADADTEQKVVDSIGSYGYSSTGFSTHWPYLSVRMRIRRRRERRRTPACLVGCSTSPTPQTKPRDKPRRPSCCRGSR